MKRLLTLMIVALLMFAAPVAHSFSMVAYEPPSNAVFGGVRYTSADAETYESGLLFSVGYAKHVTGSFWTFAYTDVGQYGSLSVEPAMMFTSPQSSLQLGVLAGPDVLWTETDDPAADPVAYIVGAAGLIGTYQASATFGLWGYGKYLITKEDQRYVKEGWVLGGGIYTSF